MSEDELDERRIRLLGSSKSSGLLLNFEVFQELRKHLFLARISSRLYVSQIRKSLEDYCTNKLLLPLAFPQLYTTPKA